MSQMTPKDVARLAYDRYRLAIIQAHHRANKIPCPGVNEEYCRSLIEAEEFPPYEAMVGFIFAALGVNEPAPPAGEG